ncbi:GGDEF domain-containing protein [Vibrio sinaloensis]|nr:GGDEF domain-containing protein [Vibrio sinaloensis]
MTTFEQRAKLLEGCFLLTLDIDDFKSINDSYGHAAGDDVLKQVVERLATVAGQQHIYRMGGEEFVIVLPNTSSQQTGISRWVKQLQASVMGKPMCFQGSELEVTFSAGVEQFSQAKGLDKNPFTCR